MSTIATEVPERVSRAKSKGARSSNAIDRNTIRAIEEAVALGSGRTLQHAMAAEAAYYHAERRGFEPGHELDDWLTAEAEIRSLWTRALEDARLPPD